MVLDFCSVLIPPFPFFICQCVSDVMRECLIGILTAVSMLGPIFPYVNAQLCGGTSANVQGLSLHRTGVTFIMPASNSFSLRSIQYQSFQTLKRKDPLQSKKEKPKSKRKERMLSLKIQKSKKSKKKQEERKKQRSGDCEERR